MVDDVSRALLGFDEDQSEVFANDTEADELDRAHEEDHDEETGPPASGGLVDQGVGEAPGGQDRGEKGGEKAELGDQPERIAAEADQTVGGEAKQGAQSVFRLSRLTRSTLVNQAHLAEPDERPQPPDKPTALGEARHRIDSLPVHQAEVARIERDLEIRDRLQEAVKQEVSQALEDVFLAFLADRIDDVVPHAPELNELRDDLGGILEVAVHDDDPPALCAVEPRRDSGLMSEIAAEVHGDETGVSLGDRVDPRRSDVSAAVVDEDDLVRLLERVQDRAEPSVKLVYRLLLVEKRHDDADLDVRRLIGDLRWFPSQWSGSLPSLG